MKRPTRTIHVRCTFVLPVEVPAEWVDDGHVYFAIEENSCPGTGLVGAALDRIMDEHEAAHTCWACACGGENKIVSEAEMAAEAEREAEREANFRAAFEAARRYADRGARRT